MKNVIKAFILTLAPAIGGVAIVAGDLDDAPGLSGLGFIIFGIAMYLNIKRGK